MRTVEDVLREYLGQQILNLAKMTAELEQLRAEKAVTIERIKELEKVIDRMTQA